MLRDKGIFFDKSSNLFQTIQSQFSLGIFGLFAVPVISFYSLVEAGIVHPLCVQFMDCGVSEVEFLADLSEGNFGAG